MLIEINLLAFVKFLHLLPKSNLGLLFFLYPNSSLVFPAS